MSDDSSTANPEAEVPVLDGVWLRRERERIAIGRRQVAERLGLPESQVSRVEMNKRLVPSEWFAALVELGFPVPSNLLTADSVSSAPLVREDHAPAPADVPSAADTPGVPVGSVPVEIVLAPVVSATVEIHGQPVETDLLSKRPEPASLAEPVPEPALEPVPESVVEAEPTTAIPASATLADVPNPAVGPAEPVIAPPAVPPLSSIDVPVSGAQLRGRWLRAQRQAREVSLLQISRVLGIPKSSFARFEASDMPVPPSWLPKLAALKLLDGESDLVKRPPPAPHYTGRWLRRERKGRGMTFIAIAPALHVAPSLLAFTETHDWPLPPEWLSGLHTLGLLESASDRSSKTARTTQKAAHEKTPQQSKAAPKSPKRQAARAASAPADRTRGGSIGRPLSGEWLRRHRLRKNILQRELAKRLKMSQSHLSRYEMQDRPLRPEWLPILQKLGFPVPTTPHENLQTPKRAAAAVAAKPVASMSARALDPAPRIDGRWAAARLAQTTPSTDYAPPPRSEPKAKYRRAASSASTSDGKPDSKSESQPLTGAWLRQQRRQRNLMQRELSARLKTNPSELCRYEMKDRPLRPDWLPILRELGFPLPTAPNDRSPQTRAAAVAESVKPSAKSATQETARTAIDGRWLKSERTRLGLSVHAVRLHLHVSAKTYARFEASRCLVPRFWWPGLRQIGMHLPATPPAQPAQPTQHSGPWNGAWLVRERRRLRLTQYEVCRVLQANPRMIHRIERDAAELPKAWLAKLPLLGIAVDAAAAQRSAAGKTSRPAKTVPNTPPSSRQKPARPASPAAHETIQSAPAATAASQRADLVALIVNFRLTLGQQRQQPPFEILNRILSDLREAGADQTLTHEDVDRAARALIQRR